ncbi:MAG: competence/damage-inducible protein A [Ignavibacteria bacterium]|jgi:nicotinamide-nucleotide amidase|nr:competence/damage-inducible protein A [Ignavibacteria bacterium]MDH7528007.1 competence/damage-inducible protein A [Ignavibacteria bacterium]
MNKVSIISIGDELLIGQTINTNAAYIGEKLTSIGYEVIRNFTVGDNKEDIIQTLSDAELISDFIFITGGLGPTHDDITRTCIVEYFKTDLVFDEQTFERIKKLFERRKIPMPEINREQAMVPRIARVIPNDYGTAPGYDITKDGKRFFVMPGVPYEMRGMMENTILPDLKKYIQSKNIFYNQKILYTTGIPESALYSRLEDLKPLFNEVKVAFLPSQFGVKIRLSMRSNNEQLNLEKIKSLEEKIRERVGEFIYTDEDLNLEEVIGKILTEKKLKIAVAESCTGGLICNRITNIPGSSNYFERGVVSYSNEAKIQILGVNPETIKNFGAVSEQTAIEMARGVRKISNADIGISTTGIMGPTGATETKPVGLVYIGYSDGEKEFAKQFNFADNRVRNKERTSQAALDILRRALMGMI